MNYRKLNILLTIFNISFSYINSAIGDLDTTFGTNGIATTSIGTNAIINSVAIQTDGKIVAGGQVIVSGKTICAVTRYNTNGAIDTTFGTNGIVTTDPGGTQSVINKIAIQIDGKIVAIGSISSTGGLLAIRYNSDGSRDSSFGTNGIFTTTNSSNGRSLALQSDGKIVAGGQTGGMRIVRLTTAGALDTSFGSGGVVSIGSNAAANTLAIQSDGKILVAGQSSSGSIVARLNTDGSLDTSFASSGIRTFTIYNSVNNINSISVQSDNKIIGCGLTAGSARPYYTAFAFRLNTDGSFDNSFGINGISILTSFNMDVFLQKILIVQDMKTICTGFTQTQFLILRLNSDGSLDTSFASPNGYTLTQIGSTTSQANGSAIQTAEKVVLGGFSGSPNVFSLARYITSESLKPTTLTYSMVQANSLVVDAPGLLTGQSSGSTAVILSLPNHGIISTNTDGSFVYVPNLDFTGLDSFTYAISTNGTLSNTINSVQITVYPNSNIPTSGIAAELINSIRQKYGTLN